MKVSYNKIGVSVDDIDVAGENIPLVKIETGREDRKNTTHNIELVSSSDEEEIV